MTLSVVFAGQNGPFAPPVLDYLLRAQDEHFQVTTCLLGRRGGNNEPHFRWRRAGVRSHFKTWFSQNQPTTTDLALGAGIPVLEISDIGSELTKIEIEKLQGDILVCAGFSRLFPIGVLEAFKEGALNIHPSKLPEWRGPSPILWQLHWGIRDWFVSIHHMDTREDHGPVLSTQPFAVSQTDSGAEIFHAAGRRAAPALLELLKKAAVHGLPEGCPQLEDGSQTPRAGRPDASFGRIRQKEWDAEHVVRFASGARFFLRVYVEVEDELFFVKRGLRVDESGDSIPGDCVIFGHELFLQCAQGVAVLELEAS
ncbi:MAG: formyltransferase family protein [Myxococcota bacterium]|nr:formyltransferase family protein [Myxococcota bacterium]